MFLIAAPLLVLWTAGYRYSFSRGRLEKTGVIFVATSPSGAAVTLNGEPLEDRTPARLTRLAAGTYQVRIERDGFAPWESTIDVPAGGTAFLNDIVLFRQEIPTLVHEFGFDDAAFSADGVHAAFLSDREGFTELRVSDLESGVLHLPYRAEQTPDAPFELSWSPDGTRLLVRHSYPNRPVFLLWDEARPMAMTDLRTIAPGTALIDASWSDDGDLYGSDGRLLYGIDPALRRVTEAGPAAEDMRVADGTVYGFETGTDETLVVSRPLRSDAFSEVAALPIGAYRFIGEEGAQLIARSQDDRLYFIDPAADEGAALVFEARGTEAEWAPDGRRALYWTGLELRVFDRVRRTDDVITRIGVGLREARWYPLGDVILFAAETGLFTAEARGTGRALAPLATFTQLKAFGLDEDGLHIHYAGTIGRQTGLWSMRLR